MAHIIKESAQGLNCVSPEDVLLTDRKIFFTSEVTSESCDELIKELMALNTESDEEISLYINSPGGDVSSGLAVYDYTRIMRAPLRTVCIGTAASMGAIIFLAGSRRELLPSSRILIHDPSYGTGDIGGMKPHEIQTKVDKLMETRDMLASIISEVTGRPVDEILKVTREDSIYNAREAVEFGLATSIINPRKEHQNHARK